jgi:hypothetical protein
MVDGGEGYIEISENSEFADLFINVSCDRSHRWIGHPFFARGFRTVNFPYANFY